MVLGEGKTDVIAVSAEALPALAGVARAPAYERGGVTAAVVHLGVGAFHRSHQARYFDDLMEATGDLRWGICGVGVLPGDEAMKDALQAQDGLYTLVEKDGSGSEALRVVGSLVEYLFAPDDPEAVIERMADPEIRIVSLTITEGGYGLDPEDPDVAHDLGTDEPPRTAFGLVCEALRRRRERDLPPFTVMSCDNLEENGRLARDRLTSFARGRDPQLGDWIEREGRFPNSMVDRITAVTLDEHRTELAERHGIRDRWPVVCEPYTEWVLEDSFVADRPPLERVGVRVVGDVAPYELMKLRLLNGSHQALCYLAYLAGYRLVHEAAQDPLFRDLLRGYMDEEATPTLRDVPGVDLDAYKRTLVERFSNGAVRDTVARLCAFGSDRLPTWLVPVVREQLAAGREFRHCATVIAGWARYAEGTDEDGEPIDIVDRLGGKLTERARRQRKEPLAFLEDRELFGNLADDERFTEAYRAALASLHRDGARATVRALIHSTRRDEESHG